MPIERVDLSEKVATRPLTPEEQTRRDDALARLPEIMDANARIRKKQIDDSKKRYIPNRGSNNILLKSALTPTTKLPFRLGK